MARINLFGPGNGFSGIDGPGSGLPVLPGVIW